MTLARRSTVESDTIIVDTMGLLLAVVVHPANIQDRDGAKLVIDKIDRAVSPHEVGLGRCWLCWKADRVGSGP